MGKPQHILVIRLSAMGDVAMTVPVLKSLTEKNPQLKITFLTRKFFSPFFKDLNNVEVFEADLMGKHKGFTGLKKLSEELKNREIDAVADLHNVLRTNVLKLFFNMYGVPVRQIDKGRAEKRALTRPKNKNFRQLKTTHQRYADVFSALGYPVDLSSPGFLPKKKLSRIIRDLTGVEPKKWVGIAPFAQHSSKEYPQDLMKEVLKELQEFKNIKLFLFGGGKHEKEILSSWEKEFSETVSVAGKLSFEEELALISNLDAMLSMDSGNGHMAANYGIPVISLWGLTHPYTGFAPFKQPETNFLLPDLSKYPAIPTSVYGKTIPDGYQDAMRSIAPTKVVEKIGEILYN